jgi:uncharacterized protein YutE (UPF0331/DUF86 family)
LVDSARVLGRLERLDSLLALLERTRAAGEEAYVGNVESRLAVERALQLALQIAIDVGAHLVSELGLQAPEDYRGVFKSLRDGGVVGAELAERLGAAAGLRNLLVHAYAELDERQIWAALGRLEDLRLFAAAALAATEGA